MRARYAVRMIGRFMLLASLAAAPARAQSAPGLPALPAAAAPVSSIHDRAADLLRRIESVSPGDARTISGLQAEWNQLKAIQRGFGSDPDTHVRMRQAKAELARLNSGLPASSPPSGAAAPPPAPGPALAAAFAPPAASEALRRAAAASGATLFDGAADADGAALAPGASDDGALDGKPGKKKKKDGAKKDKKDKPEKFHKHIWSTNYKDAATVILQKYFGSTYASDKIDARAERMAEKLSARAIGVNWDAVKKFRLKTKNGEFILRLKFKDHQRISVDLGDTDLWIPGIKKKKHSHKQPKKNPRAPSLGGKRGGAKSAKSGGKSRARRSAKLKKSPDFKAVASKMPDEKAQLAAARAAAARALRLARATAKGLSGRGSRAAAHAVSVSAVRAGRAGAPRTKFFSRGPGFDAESFTYLGKPGMPARAAAAAASDGVADAPLDGPDLRDAVAASPAAEPAASANARALAADAGAGAAAAAETSLAVSRAQAAAGVAALLALAALTLWRAFRRDRRS